MLIALKGPRERSGQPSRLKPGDRLRVGSAPESDVRLHGSGVQPTHAVLECEASGVRLQPLAGALIRLNGAPVEEATQLHDGDWLLLGRSPFVVSLGDPSPEPTAGAGASADQETYSVGRLSTCDVRIESPVVSRHHALLGSGPEGAWLEDLGSTNGTFVDGRRLQGRAPLAVGTRVRFASFGYRFDGAALTPEAEGRLRVVARGVERTVRERGRRELRHVLFGVNMAIEPGEFVAILGPSGSGKSTLLDVLSGRRAPSAGTVRYNDLDVHRHFAMLRTAIGYVPQQDIVHRRIQLRRALGYAAQLRLPEDTSEDELRAHVARVLESVGLTEQAGLPIDTPEPLSGGQLKRVNLAIELLSNPPILFLDEPTSGLDAATDRRLMALFAELAAGGKTVVCVTHSLAYLDACDLAVVLHEGRLAYVGPPKEAGAHFGVARLEDVYDALERAPAERFAERFAASSLASEYVERRLRDEVPAGPGPEAQQDARPARARIRTALRQARILTHRYIDLLLADRRNLALQLLQAPVIGAIIGLVFRAGGSLAERAARERQAAFVLVTAAIWFGCLNAAREIVKEVQILRRERAVNLEVGPYLASKLGPLALISGLQVLGLVAVADGLLEGSGGTIARAGVLWLASFAAALMGLCASALVDSSDKAVAAVPLLLVPQVVLANAIVRLDGAGELIARASIISYWAFDAMKTLLAPELREAPSRLGAPSVAPEFPLGASLAALAMLCAAFLAAAYTALRVRAHPR